MEKGLRPEASPCARHIFSKRLNVADFVRKQTTMNSVRVIAMLTVMTMKTVGPTTMTSRERWSLQPSGAMLVILVKPLMFQFHLLNNNEFSPIPPFPPFPPQPPIQYVIIH